MTDELTWPRTEPNVLASGVDWGSEDTRGDPIVAILAIDEDLIIAAFGPPTLRDVVLDGIGDMDVWTLGWPCGCEVALWRVRPAGRPADEGVDVLSNDADVDHVLHHLALTADVRWRADERSARERPRRPERWTLVRQDDHGNRFPMRRFDSKLAAECARATYEARGHKQLYTIERDS